MARRISGVGRVTVSDRRSTMAARATPPPAVELGSRGPRSTRCSTSSSTVALVAAPERAPPSCQRSASGRSAPTWRPSPRPPTWCREVDREAEARDRQHPGRAPARRRPARRGGSASTPARAACAGWSIRSTARPTTSSDSRRTASRSRPSSTGPAWSRRGRRPVPRRDLERAQPAAAPTCNGGRVRLAGGRSTLDQALWPPVSPTCRNGGPGRPEC